MSKGITDLAASGHEKILKIEEMKQKVDDMRGRAQDYAQWKKANPNATPEQDAAARTQMMQPSFSAAKPTSGGELSDETATYLATMFRKTGQAPPMGMGGAADRRKVYSIAAKQAADEGSSADEDAVNRASYRAESQTLTQLTKQQAAIDSFERTAAANGEVLVNLVDKVDSTGVPVLERWIRGGRQALAGDTDVTNFNTQLGVFVPEVAKILSNPNLTGILSDQARKDTEALVSKNFTADQIKSTIPLLEQDFGRRSKSVADEIKMTKDNIRSLGKGDGEGGDDKKPSDHPPIPTGVPSDAQWSPSQKKFWWQENGEWKSKAAD
jgi:hypothetical protein